MGGSGQFPGAGAAAMGRATEALRAALHEALPPAGGRVAIACSGGRDSALLLHLAGPWLLGLGHSVVVLHVDHRARADSADDAEAVRALSKSLRLPFRMARLPLGLAAQASGPAWEARARRARYAALRGLAADAKATELWVAHHAEDARESTAMRLLAGAGLPGLGGPYERRPLGGICLVRPWLRCAGTSLDAATAEMRIQPREDPSNADLRFSRNMLRQKVLPRLAQSEPELSARLTQLGLEAARLDQALREAAACWVARRYRSVGSIGGLLEIAPGEREPVASRHPEWQRAVLSALRRVLGNASGLRAPLASDARGAWVRALHRPGVQVLGRGLTLEGRAKGTGRELWLLRTGCSRAEARSKGRSSGSLRSPEQRGRVAALDLEWELEWVSEEQAQTANTAHRPLEPRRLQVLLDGSKAAPELGRARRGDRHRSPSRSGSKALGRAWRDLGLPAGMRAWLPVWRSADCDEREPLYAFGLEPSFPWCGRSSGGSGAWKLTLRGELVAWLNARRAGSRPGSSPSGAARAR